MALTETTHAGGYLLFESSPLYCRENGTLNTGQNCDAGEVLGRNLSAGAAVAVGTPTGNGTITIAATIGARAKVGTYRLRCVAAATNAGTFHLIDPDGIQARANTASGAITVGGGATVTDHLTVTVADGSTDFAAGDEWTVAVTSGDYEALDTAATDGTQIAQAILYAGTDATSTDVGCTVTARATVVNGDELTWPSGISDANKAIATASLAARGIIIR